MQESKWVRELILSDNPDSILLGLVLNDSFNCFPNVRKFYRKHKHISFWHFNRLQTVNVSMIRYYAISAVLNNELKTNRCYFWLDFQEPNYKTPWQQWQQHITNYLKWPYEGIIFTGGGHPYTSMFVRLPFC
jgi:hypothetical protein